MKKLLFCLILTTIHFTHINAINIKSMLFGAFVFASSIGNQQITNAHPAGFPPHNETNDINSQQTPSQQPTTRRSPMPQCHATYRRGLCPSCDADRSESLTIDQAERIRRNIVIDHQKFNR